jgi:glycosyltransferase involved in cell wall biosynthesis
VVNGTPENREVTGDVGLYFQAEAPSTLAAALEEVRRDPEEARRRGARAAERATRLFSWEWVADQYSGLFSRLSQGSTR